jgi:hypothetical protein
MVLEGGGAHSALHITKEEITMARYYITIKFKGEDQGGFNIEAANMPEAFRIAGEQMERRFSKLDVGYASIGIKQVQNQQAIKKKVLKAKVRFMHGSEEGIDRWVHEDEHGYFVKHLGHCQSVKKDPEGLDIWYQTTTPLTIYTQRKEYKI